MQFEINIKDNQIVRKGRPNFSTFVQKKLAVANGQDRRHILHGATQINDVLVTIFNEILSEGGVESLTDVLDKLLNKIYKNKKDFLDLPIEKKISKIIAYAFGRSENLVIGSSIANQGIEAARQSIQKIKEDLDKYCSSSDEEPKNFSSIQKKCTDLLDKVIEKKTSGNEVTKYKIYILSLLRESVNTIEDSPKNIASLIKLLADFEFSCTVDIIHDGTDKAANEFGITMSNNLEKAIHAKDHDKIFEILLESKR